jgi:hypothetical protein
MADKDKQPQQADFDKAWERIKSGKGRLPTENDMGPMGFPAPAKMPELKTKDTGDKNEVDLKGNLPKGYENAKPVKKGGMIKKMAKGGSVSSASKRADGCASKGKTKGRII